MENALLAHSYRERILAFAQLRCVFIFRYFWRVVRARRLLLPASLLVPEEQP